MATDGTHGFSGKVGSGDANGAVALRLPLLLTVLPSGPWSASALKQRQGKSVRTVASIRHLDGRLHVRPLASLHELHRLADVLNGWEAARWFHPDHPDRWRVQGDPLPPDPSAVRLEALAAALAAGADREALRGLLAGWGFDAWQPSPGEPVAPASPRDAPEGRLPDLPGQTLADFAPPPPGC